MLNIPFAQLFRGRRDEPKTTQPEIEPAITGDAEIKSEEGGENTSENQDPVPPPYYNPFGAEPQPFADSGTVVARAGEALESGPEIASRDQIIEAVSTVYDPEIPVNIYILGLIYEIEIDAQGEVKIDMTLTSPGCPVAGILPQQVADAAAAIDGAGTVEITLVWDPPWTADLMSEEAKLALGMF